MTRPNVLWPARNARVRFVGGMPSPLYSFAADRERVHAGEVAGEPFFSDGTTWVRVSVPGFADDVLGPVENLRP